MVAHVSSPSLWTQIFRKIFYTSASGKVPSATAPIPPKLPTWGLSSHVCFPVYSLDGSISLPPVLGCVFSTGAVLRQPLAGKAPHRLLSCERQSWTIAKSEQSQVWILALPSVSTGALGSGLQPLCLHLLNCKTVIITHLVGLMVGTPRK